MLFRHYPTMRGQNTFEKQTPIIFTKFELFFFLFYIYLFLRDTISNHYVNRIYRLKALKLNNGSICITYIKMPLL